MRWALRIDANQAQVVSALQAAGAQVDVIGKPVDLLVGKGGRMMLMEVKSLLGKRKPRAAAKTPAQERFFERWQGYPVALVDGPEAALRHLAVLMA